MDRCEIPNINQPRGGIKDLCRYLVGISLEMVVKRGANLSAATALVSHLDGLDKLPHSSFFNNLARGV